MGAFESIKMGYGMEPTVEHYGCMVDLLGRAGLLSEAFDLRIECLLGPMRLFGGICLELV